MKRKLAMSPSRNFSTKLPNGVTVYGFIGLAISRPNAAVGYYLSAKHAINKPSRNIHKKLSRQN